MSDRILRKKIIRLAHQKPHLRRELLPLLKTATRYASDPILDQAAREFIQRTDQLGFERPSVLDSGHTLEIEYNHPNRVDMMIQRSTFRGRPRAFFNSEFGKGAWSADKAIPEFLKGVGRRDHY